MQNFNRLRGNGNVTNVWTVTNRQLEIILKCPINISRQRIACVLLQRYCFMIIFFSILYTKE